MDNELELMRKQLALLQNKLDKEVTLREESLRKLLKKGAHSFRNREIVAIVIVAVCTLLLPLVLFSQDMSPALCIFTAISCLLGLFYDIWKYHQLHIGHILDQSLLQAQDDLQRYRELARKVLFFVGIPWVLIWMSWYAYENYMIHMPDITSKSVSYHVGYMMGMLASMLVGGLIGGMIGYFSILRPQMRLAREMQEQIADLTRE